MRILLANWTARRVAGAEMYLQTVLAGLGAAGHEVAFLTDTDVPQDRPPIVLPRDTPSWTISRDTLEQVRGWRPDVIYAHGPCSEWIEVELLKIAPGVYFAHNYYGTCISGLKTWQFPSPKACTRRFGWPCLLHYFPHRCGGLNPVTMIELYRRELARLNRLRRYRYILTHSDWMREEYLRHDFAAETVQHIPFAAIDDEPMPTLTAPTTMNDGIRLVYFGRIEKLKGGMCLLDSLARVSEALKQPLQLTFGGDGPAREDWERHAAALQSANPRLTIDFSGWVDAERMSALLASSHLLVVPSLWPEPFGMVGPEAGRYGVPCAAFDLGGIPAWLTEGVNGHLAPATPPTAEGLAAAIVRCVRDASHYSHLRQGAQQEAARFTLARHLDALIPFLASAAGQR
jgi:glycosyltransferase involved in cell wall biosynthesis